ncbi:MAG: LLM class flavin-dependent oxidoreductase [Pseudomonadales bacterium]|jgi:probable F420-dependent oxidoreductase|nr:LLM class flavin-dependent oxidoreductase [Pseudomonadales bacterium]
MTFSAGIGLGRFPFEDGAGFWEWVDLCEEGGVGTIWQSDRLVGRDPNLECMSVMAALAGRTKRLRFGMNVASLGLRDPFLLAKACATVDVLSGGRLLPMVAVGSAIGSDYRARGVPTKGRGQRTDEGLEIMTRLWTEPEVDFEGRHYHYRGASIAPQPVQNPMPLWVGGVAPAAIERTARWGTGWQAGLETPEQVKPVVEAIKARCEELGRSIDEDHYGAGFAFRFGSPADAPSRRHLDALERRLGSAEKVKDYVVVGDENAILERIAAFRNAGIHKFVLGPMTQGTSDMLEQTRLLIERVLPEIAAMNRAAAA